MYRSHILKYFKKIHFFQILFENSPHKLCRKTILKQSPQPFDILLTFTNNTNDVHENDIVIYHL